MTDLYDYLPAGARDTENDCPCERSGLPCADCEAETLADAVDDYEPDVTP